MFCCRKEYKNNDIRGNEEDVVSSDARRSSNGDTDLTLKCSEEMDENVSDAPSTSQTCNFLKPFGGTGGLCQQNACNKLKRSDDKKDFYRDMVNSVKSTEYLLEIQPLLEEAQKTY